MCTPTRTSRQGTHTPLRTSASGYLAAHLETTICPLESNMLLTGCGGPFQFLALPGSGSGAMIGQLGGGGRGGGDGGRGGGEGGGDRGGGRGEGGGDQEVVGEKVVEMGAGRAGDSAEEVVGEKVVEMGAARAGDSAEEVVGEKVVATAAGRAGGLAEEAVRVMVAEEGEPVFHENGTQFHI